MTSIIKRTKKTHTIYFTYGNSVIWTHYTAKANISSWPGSLTILSFHVDTAQCPDKEILSKSERTHITYLCVLYKILIPHKTAFFNKLTSSPWVHFSLYVDKLEVELPVHMSHDRIVYIAYLLPLKKPNIFFNSKTIINLGWGVRERVVIGRCTRHCCVLFNTMVWFIYAKRHIYFFIE